MNGIYTYLNIKLWGQTITQVDMSIIITNEKFVTP